MQSHGGWRGRSRPRGVTIACAHQRRPSSELPSSCYEVTVAITMVTCGPGHAGVCDLLIIKAFSAAS